jgi:DNA invertase Pin-like site-specific DNA recombinase
MRHKSLVAPTGAPDAGPALVAYYRVSTAQQGRSGLGLEAQRFTVVEHAGRLGGEIIHEFTDIESGRKTDRPELTAAIAACQKHRATLVVAKLDRLARNAPFLLTVYEGLKDRAAGVHFCDLPDLPTGPMGLFFVSLMAAIARLERDMISDRTKAALQAAKARGVKLGNPNLRSNGAGVARKRQARGYARDVVLPAIARAQKAGCTTLTELAEALAARGIRTPSGLDNWSPEQVRRQLKHRI